ncbi:MAG: PilX N-terminal domain-containing pilus assembly protein [Gammaproteobacteria bacterium]|nr:PilX N-terminal domain-containing pilus assembly protein [Gammaproteobacteria bacterium]MDH5629557.1 PilX N-terminal domain-containing pilus assembly protein [Gammaproteobacteria bacterium]
MKHDNQLMISGFGLRKQGGAALFVSLIILLILTIIGLSSSQRGHLQERVAGNTHVRNIVFNSAESAIGGFLVEANTGNRADPAHVLFNLRIEGALSNMCYNNLGQRLPCDGNVYLDSDRSGAISSSLNASVLEHCNTQMCRGFSLGQGGGGYGCRIFKIDGTGSMGSFNGGTPSDTPYARTVLWAYELTACAN